MKKMLFVAVLCAFVAAPAIADLSWQREPVLGYAFTDAGDGDGVTTDSVMISIPHPSVLEGASVSVFHVGDTAVNGSGVYYTLGQTYNTTGVYNFLGTPGRSVNSDNFTETADTSYVMNFSWLGAPGAAYQFSAGDIGSWSYTETWTNQANGADFISSTANFTVVPVPGAVLLGFLGLSAAGIKLRKFV